MRYAEALLCWHKYREMFTFEPFAPVVSEADGRRYSDDHLVVLTGGEVRPIFSCNTVPKETLETLEFKVLS